MGLMLKCRVLEPGCGHSESFELRLESESVTVRSLLQRRVARELESRRLAKQKAVLPNARSALAAAEAAFERNQLLVLHGERQCLALDEVVTARSSDEVTFIRLVPLASG